jgi:hypothetical protein
MDSLLEVLGKPGAEERGNTETVDPRRGLRFCGSARGWDAAGRPARTFEPEARW